MEKFYCGNCGHPNPVENKFCNKCGSELIRSDASDIEVKNKKIKELKPKKTLPSNYEILRQKLNLLIKTSGYFTMYSNNRYIQYLKHDTENKLYIAPIHVDNTEKEILNELESLKFEPVEENLIRSFDIVSKQKTVSEVVLITKKIFEEIYKIDPSEPFCYEVLNEENLQTEKVVGKLKVVDKNESKSDNRRITIFIIVVIILIAYYLHVTNTSNVSNNNNTETTQKQSLPDEETAFIISQEFVKQNLKSPHTAVFPTSDFTGQAYDSDSSFKVASYVDSQNSFGASIRTKYIVLVKYKGGDEYDVKNWRLDNILLFNENGEIIH